MRQKWQRAAHRSLGESEEWGRRRADVAPQRRLFPGVTDMADAQACARTIAAWKRCR
jgi:hypothetical protein